MCPAATGSRAQTFLCQSSWASHPLGTSPPRPSLPRCASQACNRGQGARALFRSTASGSRSPRSPRCRPVVSTFGSSSRGLTVASPTLATAMASEPCQEPDDGTGRIYDSCSSWSNTRPIPRAAGAWSRNHAGQRAFQGWRIFDPTPGEALKSWKKTRPDPPAIGSWSRDRTVRLDTLQWEAGEIKSLLATGRVDGRTVDMSSALICDGRVVPTPSRTRSADAVLRRLSLSRSLSRSLALSAHVGQVPELEPPSTKECHMYKPSCGSTRSPRPIPLEAPDSAAQVVQRERKRGRPVRNRSVG